MKRLYILFAFLFLQINSFAQDTKIGRHTVAEWNQLIDSTWGEGRTTVEKLQIFDLFWNAIDQRYAAFEGIEDNWQEIYTYRDTIALGVSRGKFSGILSHIVKSLHDGHVYMFDSIFGFTPLQKDVPLLVPVAIEYPSFNWGITDYFGAALTPLTDSTLLVYSAVNNHPLGLVPGDIVLGYDGVLWKDLYKKLWKIQFPMKFFFVINCSDRAAAHEWLGAAGLNWHLFDTIDILKYATGDTVHLPTDLLSNPMPGIHATEQMPINGVPFPDVENGHHVSWGYIEGTKIGYIYVYGWHFLNSIDEDFLSAVNTIMPDSSSDGLIIDLRTNEGSDLARWTKGFRRLFNEDFEAIKHLKRANSNNHLDMTSAPEWDFQGNLVGSDNQLYDRPIAVLCGPWTHSGGDYSVQLLRQHPMVRTFGLPTPGAFGPTLINDISGLPGEWTTGITVAVGYTPPNWNNRLYRRSIPVDKEVWLTPDGVANGEDDVVNSALDWINNVFYPHKVVTDKTYYLPSQDTVHLSTTIENPNSHQLSARAYFKTFEGVLIDSVDLTHHVLNQDGEQWVANFSLPMVEEFYKISITSFDQTASTSFTVPNATRITTAGPLNVDSIESASISNFRYTIKPFIKNGGNSLSISDIIVELYTNDPWVTSISPSFRPCPNLLPGEVKSLMPLAVSYDSATFPGYFNLRFEILSGGYCYWKDSLKFEPVIVGLEEEANEIPTEFLLSQNYPNPFNSSSIIKYSIPKTSQVTVKIFNTLGEDIETLVNEEKPVGTYELSWSASNLPSGVYFYQLSATGGAGSFVETKKMLLIK